MEVETAQAMGDAKRRGRSRRLTSYISLWLQVPVYMNVRSSWLKRASCPLVQSSLITVVAHSLRCEVLPPSGSFAFPTCITGLHDTWDPDLPATCPSYCSGGHPDRCLLLALIYLAILALRPAWHSFWHYPLPHIHTSCLPILFTEVPALNFLSPTTS